MSADQLMQELPTRLKKCTASLAKEYGKLRTGRANLQMFEDIRVDYYGTPTPLAQVANLAIPDPKMITIKPWEKQLAPEIEKAINRANLGLNAQADGELVRIPVPALSEERRQELAKVAKRLAEDARIAIRNVRRDVNEGIKKDQKSKEISEDDAKRMTDQVQKAVDSEIKQVDEVLSKKEKETLEF